MRLLKIGVVGEDVKKWQQILMDSGHDLSPWNDDGKFGESTHNSTLSWQKDRCLKADGIVGPKTWGAVNEETMPQADPFNDCLNIDFIQAKNYTRANRKDIKWIVLHSMEAPEASTTAENVSHWFAGPSAPKASAHYCIDDDSIVQCVKDEDVAWHAGGGNKYGIGLEHAGYARQTRQQWLDTFSIRMLKRSAKLAASVCKRWNIPVEYVDREDLKNGKRGITTHNEITYAFRKSSHVDPGESFPMDLYLQWIKDCC